MNENGVYQDGELISRPPAMTPAVEAAMQDAPKKGRPKGFDGTKSRMPSALAQSFRKAGLDWKEDFALAIKANNRARIKLWLRLLPYMITTSHRTKVKKWKGRASKAAMIALEAMEREP